MVDAFNIMQDRITRARLAGDPPDLLISPRVGQIGWFDFHRADDLIAHGTRAAERAIDSIQEAIHILAPAPSEPAAAVEKFKYHFIAGFGGYPFVGTPQLQGLKIMMALINNWDLKDANNVILKDGNELQYAISDLGATFGHASTTPLLWRFTRSRNNPSNYAKSDFFEKVKGDRVVLHYGGKNRGLMKDISVQDAQWIASLLSQLSDAQIRDAFRAANYTPGQINLLAGEVRERTNELLSLRPGVQVGRRY
jgi:hypothetical protein